MKIDVASHGIALKLDSNMKGLASAGGWQGWLRLRWLVRLGTMKHLMPGWACILRQLR